MCVNYWVLSVLLKLMFIFHSFMQNVTSPSLPLYNSTNTSHRQDNFLHINFPHRKKNTCKIKDGRNMPYVMTLISKNSKKKITLDHVTNIQFFSFFFGVVSLISLLGQSCFFLIWTCLRSFFFFFFFLWFSIVFFFFFIALLISKKQKTKE